MLCKCHWIVLDTVHFTAFCVGGRFFPDTVYIYMTPCRCKSLSVANKFNSYVMWVISRLQNPTRSQAVARIADCTASQVSKYFIIQKHFVCFRSVPAAQQVNLCQCWILYR